MLPVPDHVDVKEHYIFLLSFGLLRRMFRKNECEFDGLNGAFNYV